ncbi:DUF3010 family protein [Aliidiomarina halalkaliphila]|uniref:DUF3010 family protein n=1 Tax=Aliidiomarina halalkaliphila TaxID=2593535 RepID=A0A552X4D4_9GAMM|nr:DUF3010 family protein [Aliidiomarina halalkaliphila]TRW49888.1 DUF3010 family protein [Aliidiomarina halalkaliphila]
MRVCGIEIKSNEAIICLMELDGDLVQIPDCRQTRFQLSKTGDQESMQKLQFALAKLFTDYRVSHVAIKERPQKGKFAGSALGFKIEAALQLIDGVTVHVMAGSEQKDILKRNPIPVDFADTGLKGFQETAFTVAYAFLMGKKYPKPQG